MDALRSRARGRARPRLRRRNGIRARTESACGMPHRAPRAPSASAGRVGAPSPTRGARMWASQARDELERISGRRPASGDLTATEQRLASLAADGLSNKEIAATLHLSVHTVEAHLTRIYRKL